MTVGVFDIAAVRGIETEQGKTAEGQHIAGPEVGHGNAAGFGGLSKLVVAIVGFTGGGQEQAADLYGIGFGQEVEETADVVLIAVGQDGEVNVGDALGLEIGQTDVFAEAAGGGGAHVNGNDGIAPAEHEAVSLAHIQGGDGEVPGGPGQQEKEAQQQGKRDERQRQRFGEHRGRML